MSLTAPSRFALMAGVKDNRRLRLGLWLAVGIFWLYGVLLLRDEARLATTDYQTLAKKTARMQAQLNQSEWKERVEPVLALQFELESRLWREGTIGLAQATFQDWLNQAVQQSNLTRAVVTVAAQEESTSQTINKGKAASGLDNDLWKVSAKVAFDFVPKGLYALLGRLEGHDKQIVVESLVVRSLPSPRAEMVLVSYFQKPAAPVK